jgi:hypothetical protein
MSKTVDVCESEVRFKVKKSLIRFKIYHNLPSTFGMNFEGALDNWLARTEEYTAKSLCNYILSKDIDECFAVTEKEFNHLKKDGKIKK